MAISVEKYEDLLRRSGLVEKESLDKFISKISSANGGKPADSAIFAKQLINAKLITQWQNSKLMAGRHRGFFLGKYKLLQHLAKGGMSEVYLGEQVMMRRQVAIKVFPPELIERSSYLERFYLESRALAALDHPNIVKAHDFGQEGKIHYLVMEYVDGPNLEECVQQDGVPEVTKAVEWISQAAESLLYAHDNGMIHRDVKPSNFLLDDSGFVKLLDLGLARLIDQDQASLTLKHNENALGTADYLAPEQALDSHNVDHRADLYSLGGTLYFLLTGNPPFPEGTPVQRMMAHMNQDPEPLQNINPDVPEEINRIVQKMMQKKPEDRYETVAEARDDFNAWLSTQGIVAKTASISNPQIQAVAEAPAEPEESAAPEVRFAADADDPSVSNIDVEVTPTITINQSQTEAPVSTSSVGLEVSMGSVIGGLAAALSTVVTAVTQSANIATEGVLTGAAVGLVIGGILGAIRYAIIK